MNKNNLFYTGISGVVLFVVAALAGSILLKDYNPVTQFISESYAKDAPYGFPIRIFGFIPSGILLTLFSFFSYSRFPANSFTKSGFIALGVFYGIGTILTGIFPYDSYLNNDFSKVASSSQHIHNLSGFLTYVFAPLSILSIGLGLRKSSVESKLTNFSIISSVLLMILVFILFSDAVSAFTGVLQRIIESIFLLWFVVCAFNIKAQQNE
jgi:L-cystine uptake protein TcyP (sodium:dicarboxylate symporter family)